MFVHYNNFLVRLHCISINNDHDGDILKTDYKGINIPDFLVVMKWLERGRYSMSDLHRMLNITYAHLHYMKKNLVELNWAWIEKDERTHYIHLTDKGQEIVQAANKLLKVMDFDDDKIIDYLQKDKFKQKRIYTEEELKSFMNGGNNV